MNYDQGFIEEAVNKKLESRDKQWIEFIEWKDQNSKPITTWYKAEEKGGEDYIVITYKVKGLKSQFTIEELFKEWEKERTK